MTDELTPAEAAPLDPSAVVVAAPGTVVLAAPPPVAAGAPDPGAAAAPDPTTMSLVDHLGELRDRLFKIVAAVAVGSVVGYLLSDRIIALLEQPLAGIQKGLIVLGPGDAFFIVMKVSIAVGVILAMPVILYQLWAFVGPGLTPDERRSIRPWLPMAIVFFALGVTIAYVILPYAVGFLLGFTNGTTLIASLAAGPYFDFVTTLFLAFGLVMEFPIVLYALSRVNILSSQRLRSSRRYIILGITVFATVVTPGGDLVSPFVLGVTMYILYELTTWFIARSGH
jgi:sec-independent protein translocase protein TatC